MRIQRERPLLQNINRFLYSPAYFLFLGVLTVFSNVFNMELVAYPLILLTGIYVCLFARDLLPLMPIFACGYISPSVNNNPGQNNQSIFSLQGGGLYVGLLLVLLVVSLVYRLVTDPDFGGKRFLTKKRSLLSGMLILGAAYALSGLGSGQWAEYGWRNLLFAFLQLVAIAGLYWLFSGSVRWEQAPRNYLFWMGMCVGYVLIAELLGIYWKGYNGPVVINGVIHRERIVTGWGHYNSMGALLAMILPLPFFLTGKGKFAWFAYLSAFLFCVALLFTCSRGSITFGVPLYVVCYILSLVYSRHARSLKWMHIVHGAIIILPILAIVLYSDELTRLFQGMSNIRADAAIKMRLDTYAEGFRQFTQFPVLGGSFFPLKEDLYKWADGATTFGYLFPPRWHNTLVQLLATGGIVCLAAYIFHRVQTIKLFVRNFNSEKLFIGMAILSMLLTSMVDCHFFNVGPVLLYSMMLAVVEHQMNLPADKK